jgi:magnesium transporter
MVAAETDRDVEPPQEILRTAAEHASTAVPVAAPSDTATDVLNAMRGRVFDSAAVVAVCEGNRLTGLITIERLLAASPNAPLSDLADLDPPVVAPHTNQELVAWKAVEHGEPGLAVVDDEGRFRGLISPQRLLAVLLAEHDEDMARLGGFLHSAAAARSASQEGVRRRLWHRLPWLAIGLAGAMVAAAVVGAFEADLQRQLLLAFFVPGVVYMADAVGTQTETLVIRGLSVGVGIGRVVFRELVTGLLVGILLGAVVLPFTLLVWGNAEVAVTVSLALLGACSVATLVAMALPWAFSKLGRDPAFGSGPLATVLQDLLSIVIYLGIARAIVG